MESLAGRSYPGFENSRAGKMDFLAVIEKRFEYFTDFPEELFGLGLRHVETFGQFFDEFMLIHETSIPSCWMKGGRDCTGFRMIAMCEI